MDENKPQRNDQRNEVTPEDTVKEENKVNTLADKGKVKQFILISIGLIVIAAVIVTVVILTSKKQDAVSTVDSGKINFNIAEVREKKIEKAKSLRRTINIREIQIALELFYADNGKYPLISDPTILGTGNMQVLCENGFQETVVGCDKIYTANVHVDLDDDNFNYTYQAVARDRYLIVLIPQEPEIEEPIEVYSQDGLIGEEIVAIFDTDQDKLTDDEEQLLNTDPNDADSDDDGLTDYEEVIEKNTDPNDEDTDDDGYDDGEEDNNDFNPHDPILPKNDPPPVDDDVPPIDEDDLPVDDNLPPPDPAILEKILTNNYSECDFTIQRTSSTETVLSGFPGTSYTAVYTCSTDPYNIDDIVNVEVFETANSEDMPFIINAAFQIPNANFQNYAKNNDVSVSTSAQIYIWGSENFHIEIQYTIGDISQSTLESIVDDYIVKYPPTADLAPQW